MIGDVLSTVLIAGFGLLAFCSLILPPKAGAVLAARFRRTVAAAGRGVLTAAAWGAGTRARLARRLSHRPAGKQ